MKSTPAGPRWTGKVALVESALALPLRWKKPRRIFVNSMSDLFHEKVLEPWIARIFNVMRDAEQHTFQILTKRPERMLEILGRWAASPGPGNGYGWVTAPLPNVWLGVSVENQETADERIPLLLQTPAAVRWVSYEPALGPVDFGCWVPGGLPFKGQHGILGRALDWIVVGGESGPGARPFDLAWARQTIAQGRSAGVPVFVKQLGSRPIGASEDCDACNAGRSDLPRRSHGWDCTRAIRDRKGGAMEEWPEDLRVREYPA